MALETDNDLLLEADAFLCCISVSEDADPSDSCSKHEQQQPIF